MAGENTQVPGNGVDRPVIPLQNVEEPIEIIEEDGAQPQVQRQDIQRGAGDTEQAGSYEYDADAGTDDADGGKQVADARLTHFQQDQKEGEQPQPGETQEQLTARQRRRQREKDSRNRERAEVVRLRQENAALLQNQRQIDSRLSNVEQSGIDAQISSLESEILRADHVMKRAMEAQNGDDFIQAQNIRDTFRDRLARLKHQKAEATQQVEEGQVRQQPGQTQQGGAPAGGMTQAQVSYARIFVSRHPWYKQGSADRDSQTVVQIDNEMMAEGGNPTTPDYWVELERRVKEDMPHKFQAANDGDNTGGRPNGGQQNRQQQNGRGNAGNGRAAGGPKLPGAGSGGSGAGGAPLKFHLSRDRKQSLIDLGVYGTPDQDKYIRSFIKWDKENPADGDKR